MTVINHFELRWVDGYGAVSDAPSELAVMIEELADRISRSPDGAVLAVRDIRLPNGDGARIGMLQLDVAVPSEQRPVAFLHAVVLPPGYRLDEAGWRALVTRRYGECPEERIREIYVELAVTTKDRGRDRLRALEIRPEDLKEVLGSRTSSARLKGKRASTAREAEAAAARPALASPASAPPPNAPSPLPATTPVAAAVVSTVASLSPVAAAAPAPAPAGAPIIATPGAHDDISDEKTRTASPEPGRISQSKVAPEPAKAARGGGMAPPGMLVPGAAGTWPGMELQTPPDGSGPREALAAPGATKEADAPGAPAAPASQSLPPPSTRPSAEKLVAPGAAPAADASGASLAIAGASTDVLGSGESAKSLARAPAMWGLAAIAVPALLVAVAIGLGLHAWQLAAERDRLAEELAKPRPEDPELAATREKVRRLQQELDTANKTIAELRAAAPSDPNPPSCPAILAEARARLGTADSRIATLEASLRTIQATAAKATSELEAKHAEERARLQGDVTALQTKTTELGGELAKQGHLLRTLCDELRTSHSSKVLQVCRGVK